MMLVRAAVGCEHFPAAAHDAAGCPKRFPADAHFDGADLLVGPKGLQSSNSWQKSCGPTEIPVTTGNPKSCIILI